ncbi:unnamed protein product [Fructobacillus evanidus]|nr:unnamed protein product [Fructobacillus sp. LMG 32999]
MYWLINLPILFVISWVATTRLNQLKKITDKPKRKKLSLSFGALYQLGLNHHIR